MDRDLLTAIIEQPGRIGTMNKLEGRSRSVRERRGESARRSQSRLRTWSRSDDPTSPIPTWSSGSRPALRLPKSAGKPSTGRGHAAIPTIRLSIGRRAGVFDWSGGFNCETHEQYDFDHRRWGRQRLRTHQTTHGAW